MQRLEDHTTLDRERVKLFNELCKTCSKYRVIPKSMHIPDCSEGSVEVESGGFANILRSTYKGRQVAIKVIRVYITSDLEIILGVSILSAPSRTPEWTNPRDSAERVLLGNTSGIPTSCHSLG